MYRRFSTERSKGKSSSGEDVAAQPPNSKECNDLILVSFLHLQWRNIVILGLQSRLQPARMSAGHWLLGTSGVKMKLFANPKHVAAARDTASTIAKQPVQAMRTTGAKGFSIASV